MKLVLAGLEAHRDNEAVQIQLAVGCRTLLPATPPRPFVEAAGLELLVESINAHPKAAQLGEVAGACLHMLAAVNNIVRRMVLRMEVLKPLLQYASRPPSTRPAAPLYCQLRCQPRATPLSAARRSAVSCAPLTHHVRCSPLARPQPMCGGRAIAYSSARGGRWSRRAALQGRRRVWAALSHAGG